MPKVLIAPLDWGLGHTTRCIPLIENFLREGWAITLAAEGVCAELLQAAFPKIPLLNLKGYQIRYAKNNVKWKIIQQIPAIKTAIDYERKWLQEKFDHHQWDVIISDNRPGFHHPKAHNIYITHQLHIESGFGKLVNDIASRIHHRYIKKFQELWIPDLEGEKNLAGKLSHPKVPFLPTKYIGLISRLQPEITASYSYDLLFILSGPEPQRTMFEQILLSQVQPKHGKLLLIRGTNHPVAVSNIPDFIEIVDLANSNELNQYMMQSKYIICRSGYTSLMDLMRLRKKALLVPTPGQGEQEYLAEHAVQQHYFPALKQREFDMDQAIKKIESFQYTFPFNENDFQQVKHNIHHLTKILK